MNSSHNGHEVAQRETAVPLFEENASATFNRAIATFRTRHDQYGDTWRNNQHLTLRAVYREISGQELPWELCDCISAAVLCDTKYQRLEGGWDEDHPTDGINYNAYLVEAMRKLRATDHSASGGSQVTDHSGFIPPRGRSA